MFRLKCGSCSDIFDGIERLAVSLNLRIAYSRIFASSKMIRWTSRLLILCNLLDGEKSVGELESFLDLRQSTVSQQLARLRLEGLVAARREGKTIYYSIVNERVRAVIGVLYSAFCGVKPSRAA